GTRGECARADVHDVLVRDVGVREDDLLGVVPGDDFLELLLGDDRDPYWVELAGERGGVDASVNVRDLRRREGDDLVLVSAAVDEVEIMEVPARGACDHDPSS